MTTFAEIARWDWYCVNAPKLWAEARSRFTPEADLGAVVRYADYLSMPKADRDVADFWEAWVSEAR